MTLNELWQAALAELELNISQPNFKAWFKETSIVNCTEQEILVGVPNGFTKSWLQNRYHKKIAESLRRITDRPSLQIQYRVITKTDPELGNQEIQVASVEPLVSPPPSTLPAASTNTEPESQRVDSPVVNPTPAPTHSLPPISSNAPLREGGLNPKYTFDSFVTGKSNELARAACFAVAERPGTVYNPLFLYGGVGLGKTHLMHAAGHEIQRRADRSLRILYVSCEKFMGDFVNALKTGTIERFKQQYRSVDVLLVDDIQFIAGKEGTQEEFFFTFNVLHQSDKQVIITSDRPPKAIPALEKRLSSRFEGGMIADVGFPDIETRVAILQKKCQEKSFPLDPPLLFIIAEHVQSNIRELEGALNKVIAHHQLQRASLNADSIREILSSLKTASPRSVLTSRQIITTVCKFFDISSQDLLGASRKKELVTPRQITMYLMRDELNHSFPNIGDELGGRDHTTIMHGYVKIKEQIHTDERLSERLNLLKEQLYQDLSVHPV